MKVLVVGNGFDLDLGLGTTYLNFAQSKEFQGLYSFSQIPDSLASYLFSQVTNENTKWFDLEDLIAKYVFTKKTGKTFGIDEDRFFLKQLTIAFWKFVESEWMEKCNNLWNTPIKHSLAKAFIEKQNKTNCFDRIYSFNCFDYSLLDLASDLEIDYLRSITFIHGHSNDFIFGIAEEDCTCKDYSFLIKKNQQGYPTENVKIFMSDLKKADEIVIFGHSLNRIDMGYFKPFFYILCAQPNSNKRITFIEKNEDSFNCIKKRITKFASVSYNQLNSSCSISALFTENYENKENMKAFEDFFFRLETSCNLK